MLQHGDRVPATFRCSRDALADCASGLAAAIGRTAAVRAAQPRRELRPTTRRPPFVESTAGSSYSLAADASRMCCYRTVKAR